MVTDQGLPLRHIAYPQLWLLVPLCAGLWIGRVGYDTLSPYTFWIVAGCVVCLLLAFLLHLRRNRIVRFLSAAAFVSAVAGSGMLLVQAAIGQVRTQWPETPQNYAVRIVSLPKAATRSTGVEAEILYGNFAGRHIRLYLPDSVPTQAGTRMFVHARIETPQTSGNPYAFDWPAYLLTQGISGTAYAPKSALLPPDSTFSFRVWALRLQSRAVERLQEHFEGTDVSLLAAMTVGDKRGLGADVREVFSETGTSHLLALSGLHLGILFGLYQILVLKRVRRRGPRIVAVGIGILLMWLFALVAGMPLPLQRAATMFSLAQLMQISRRDTMGLDRLFVSALLLLLISPLSLFDVGFQLSFLSVGAILTLTPLFPELSPKLNRSLGFVYSPLVTSFCAWLGTMPVVAYYFHTIGVYGVFANVVAVGLVWLLLMCCVLFFVLPFAAGLLVPCIKVLLTALKVTLSFFAALSGSTIELYPTILGTWLALCLILAVVLWRLRRGRLYGTLAVLILCALIVEESYAHRPMRLQPQIVFYNLWRGSAVQVIRADGTSYLWTHGADAEDELQNTAREFWRKENISTPLPLDTVYRDRYVYYSRPFLSFGGKRVALLCDKQSRDTLATAVVDYLLVTKGYSGKPDLSLRRYPRATVILDASLGPIYRRMWHTSADSLHRTVHDMKRDGALVLPLGQSQ